MPAVLIEAWDQALTLGRREAKEGLSGERQALADERATFEAEAQSLRESRDLATQTLATAEARRQDVERRLTQSEKDLATVRKHHATDAAALVELRTQRKSEQQTLHAAQAEVTRIRKDWAARQSELDTLRGAHDSLASRLTEADIALSATQSALQTAEHARHAADSALAAAVTDGQERQEQIQQLTGQLAHAVASAATTEEARARLATTVERLTGELAGGVARSAALAAELATAKQGAERLAALEQSFDHLLTEIRTRRVDADPSSTPGAAPMPITKDDAIAAGEEEFEEARRRELAEQAAILIVVHHMPRDQAAERARRQQEARDDADPIELEAGEHDGLPLPKDATQRKQIHVLTEELLGEDGL